MCGNECYYSPDSSFWGGRAAAGWMPVTAGRHAAVAVGKASATPAGTNGVQGLPRPHSLHLPPALLAAPTCALEEYKLVLQVFSCFWVLARLAVQVARRVVHGGAAAAAAPAAASRRRPSWCLLLLPCRSAAMVTAVLECNAWDVESEDASRIKEVRRQGVSRSRQRRRQLGGGQYR